MLCKSIEQTTIHIFQNWDYLAYKVDPVELDCRVGKYVARFWLWSSGKENHSTQHVRKMTHNMDDGNIMRGVRVEIGIFWRAVT